MPKPVVLVFEVDPLHGLPVAGVDVVEDAEVDPDAVARVKRIQWGFSDRLSSSGSRLNVTNHSLVRSFLNVASLMEALSGMGRWYRIFTYPTLLKRM